MVDISGLDWRGFLGLYLNVWNCNFASFEHIFIRALSFNRRRRLDRAPTCLLFPERMALSQNEDGLVMSWALVLSRDHACPVESPSARVQLPRCRNHAHSPLSGVLPETIVLVQCLHCFLHVLTVNWQMCAVGKVCSEPVYDCCFDSGVLPKPATVSRPESSTRTHLWNERSRDSVFVRHGFPRSASGITRSTASRCRLVLYCFGILASWLSVEEGLPLQAVMGNSCDTHSKFAEAFPFGQASMTIKLREGLEAKRHGRYSQRLQRQSFCNCRIIRRR